MDTEHLEYSEELALVVDDDEGLGKILEGLLGQCGFKSHHVVSGSDALAELKKERTYTFLITDVQMPGMDGLELTQRVKNDFPDVCVIVMTGYSDDYRYIDVVNAGAVDFINKPFRIEELEAKIRRAIIERDTRQALEKLSITDSLTGLYNQRHFYSKLNDETTRAKRQKRQVGLILLDLDDFKRYNDNYGHLAGDERLKKFGSIITSQIREVVDSGYRYGGDEFAVILSDAGPDTCQTIGERIARVFREECDGAGVSIGCANFSDNMIPESLVAEADRCLYEDKEKKNDMPVRVQGRGGRKYR
ncbi:MAG: diguanylate cyclase [Deltaproteobacteria bacterium]|nr:diguanylate cyclase [Deltaproteobacteria bacterium]